MSEDGTGAPSGLEGTVQYRRARQLRPRTFDERFSLFNELDPHFARLWLDYGGGLFARGSLDTRTRVLLLTGQYTMLRDADALRDTLDAGAGAGVDAKEMLEVIFQCYVYGGEGAVDHAVRVYVEVMDGLDLLDDVKARGIPADAPHSWRDLGEEQASWSDSDREDPRLQPLLDRYGWFGISNGLQLRPGQHVNLVSQLDALDPAWCQIWLDLTFDGMYGRAVLDERTRILCIVGDCLATGDTYQFPRHMAGALRAGATPRELLEVVLQSCHVIGHPLLMGIALNDLVRLVYENGRIDELVSQPEKVPGLMRVVSARIAGRREVADLKTSDGLVDPATDEAGRARTPGSRQEVPRP